MVEDFGKQFTLAREAKGLTIGDVASRIKVREEYVGCIEKCDFSIQLPDVYVRGFIRNYAKLLGLDVDAVMKACPVREFRIIDSIKYSASALVESVKFEDGEDFKTEDESIKAEKKTMGDTLSFLKERLLSMSKKNLIILSGIVAVFLLILIAIFAYTRVSGELNLNGIVPVEASVIPSRSITLSATAPIRVVVRQKDTLEKIYSGNLSASTAKTVSYYKPVQVFYDRGEHLLIQQDDGEKIYPQPGRGGVEIK
jgi:cytoskeletal protein RodZ